MSVDTSQIEANIAARKAREAATDEAIRAANELAEFYIAESKSITDAHGLDAGILFLETLRDNLLQIRPLPIVKDEPIEPAYESSDCREWDDDDLPDGYVLAEINAKCFRNSGKACGFYRNSDGPLWIPISQMLDEESPDDGEYVGYWPVTAWIAGEKGLDY